VKTSLQSILLTSVIVCAIVMMAFVGISAYTEGDAQPVLLLFLGVVTPIVTQLVSMTKNQRTLDVSQATDQKVDQLLNGSLVGKVDRLEQRMQNVETSLVQILAKLP
jgi:hypothetical protein